MATRSFILNTEHWILNTQPGRSVFSVQYSVRSGAVMLSNKIAHNGLVSEARMSTIAPVVVRKLAMLSLLAFIMAGCETTSRFSAPMTTVTVPEEITIAPPTPLTDSRLPRAEPGAVARLPLAHPPAAIAANPGVASLLQPAWPTNWVNAWIPLEDWGKYN